MTFILKPTVMIATYELKPTVIIATYGDHKSPGL